jgi:hypothetical protein
MSSHKHALRLLLRETVANVSLLLAELLASLQATARLIHVL